MINCKVGLPTRLVAPGVWAVLSVRCFLFLVHLNGCLRRQLGSQLSVLTKLAFIPSMLTMKRSSTSACLPAEHFTGCIVAAYTKKH